MNITNYFFNHEAFECPICKRHFPTIYYAKRVQQSKKIYGTKQLMSLWAWYNFKRHLASHSLIKKDGV